MGSYLLGRRIGAGGMSSIYAARQESRVGIGRLVAVKMMNPALRDRTRIKMFLREALISTQLEHPNIVRTYGVLRSRGRLCLAMEFLHGVNLSSLLRETGKPLPVGVALKIAADVAAALHAAHELRDSHGTRLGIVHQDVSPHNVMVTYEGTTKLLDFGIARLSSIDASWTAAPKGKTAYIAPEQVTYGKLDRRVDIFALGVVLHELLTAKRLFGRDSVGQTISAIVNDDIPDVRTVNESVPADVAEIVARALERDPKKRYGDAEAMREALLEARDSNGIERVSGPALGAWLRNAVPPVHSPAELENEIVLTSSGTLKASHPHVSEPLTHLPRASRRARGVLSGMPPAMPPPPASRPPTATTAQRTATTRFSMSLLTATAAFGVVLIVLAFLFLAVRFR